MLRATLGIAIALVSGAALAQTGPPASEAPAVSFRFENNQLQLSRYTITLHPDGSGHFHSDGGGAPPPKSSDLPSEGLDRPIQVSAAATQRIFAAAHAKKLFAMNCEAGAKVAFTGKKELSYNGPEGQGSCQYNYSRDQQIQWITGEMQGIAETLEAGRRLELQHEHARLGLDAELEDLETRVHNGQALELGNIAPVLTAIVEDASVLERAQRRARLLLQIADAADAEQSRH
jgi:hypothetical protein